MPAVRIRRGPRRRVGVVVEHAARTTAGRDLLERLAKAEAIVGKLRDELAPLLPEWPAIPWHADPFSDTCIIGAWAEDGSYYSITVPAQLRPYIIKMQNSLPINPK